MGIQYKIELPRLGSMSKINPVESKVRAKDQPNHLFPPLTLKGSDATRWSPASHEAYNPSDAKFWVKAECFQWRTSSAYGFAKAVEILACGCRDGELTASRAQCLHCQLPPLGWIETQRIYIHRRTLSIPEPDPGFNISESDCEVNNLLPRLNKGEKIYSLVYYEHPKGMRSLITRCIERIKRGDSANGI